MSNYSIEVSDKQELGNGWRIVKDNKIFLRVLRTKGSQKYKFPYELVTATAADNSGKNNALSNQERLICIKAARKTNIDWFNQGPPALKYDWAGRAYISICVASEDALESNDTVESEMEELIQVFFKNYQDLSLDIDDSEKLKGNSLISLYEDIHVQSGEAVYLSDGMWLTPDGRIIEK
ncbi:hypothetical protein J7560_09810 [Wohlfahrtiimonas chitiniclastica]|uniref:hypothetical protein n=1 Tax=Wohlfahrtiimonas chitiniclastica TaxID=400946 RepID=UPI001BD0F466|nr:hypothetical protein [Wohlfahrtiimonas chitiniclastica]MBS7815704.1 hypothetical protein [Wohlfahrtiimonas chitiniclastica]